MHVNKKNTDWDINQRRTATPVCRRSNVTIFCPKNVSIYPGVNVICLYCKLKPNKNHLLKQPFLLKINEKMFNTCMLYNPVLHMEKNCYWKLCFLNHTCSVYKSSIVMPLLNIIFL